MKSYLTKSELQEQLEKHVRRAEERYQLSLLSLCTNGTDEAIRQLEADLDRYVKLARFAGVLAGETIELQALTDG